MTRQDLFLIETKGWRHGASIKSMDTIENPELAEAYERGYIAGQKARRAAEADCSKRTGYTPSIIRAMEATA